MLRKISWVAFIIYLWLVVDLVIMKRNDMSFQDVWYRIHSAWEARREYGYWDLSFRPFLTIKDALDSYQRYGWDSRAFRTATYNVFFFAPLGLLLPLIMKKPSAWKAMSMALFIILAVEIIQQFTGLGMADIDDVILNMAGSLIGLVFYSIARIPIHLAVSKSRSG
ncbi:VanZ family protein [Cohnella thailandensis]|uniref:VanZ family protein n=1 Tax=Cohnella thailandensis TaxID=557557 RepID=A0A841T049_9BACL|nr:VanZ family protein [Cohnella thailandensis]MBB6634421.1 VanZ family protein [Cohnella thailandensis]MBP1972079.1 glycopeptide antibiotics resistance protein [Cohnella thailandensis]